MQYTQRKLHRSVTEMRRSRRGRSRRSITPVEGRREAPLAPPPAAGVGVIDIVHPFRLATVAPLTVCGARIHLVHRPRTSVRALDGCRGSGPSSTGTPL